MNLEIKRWEITPNLKRICWEDIILLTANNVHVGSLLHLRISVEETFACLADKHWSNLHANTL